MLAETSAVRYRPPPGSVPWHKQPKNPCWVDPDGDDCRDTKINYFVPNFGEDNDIMATKKNLAAAEEAVGHSIGTVVSTDLPKGEKIFKDH